MTLAQLQHVEDVLRRYGFWTGPCAPACTDDDVRALRGEMARRMARSGGDAEVQALEAEIGDFGYVSLLIWYKHPDWGSRGLASATDAYPAIEKHIKDYHPPSRMSRLTCVGGARGTALPKHLE